jgi:hypothetical protein
MHKATLSPTLLFLLFFFLIFTPFLLSNTQKASLSYYKGLISIYRDKNPISPFVNMTILTGDSLVTGTDSNLEIKYEDGSVSSLGPNSILKIRYLKKEKGLFTTRIKAWMGNIICKISKLNKGETFQVYTPTAVATIRGTVFEANISKDKETSFKVLSGKLYATALAEGAKTYLFSDELKDTVGIAGIPQVGKLTEQELTALKNKASTYIRDFVEEKKEEIEEDIKKHIKKGCLGFF